ncbi:hypothetical protein FA13DRAFT_1712361 [Coprinellus micaceus]|uniref:Uncharacterized protein n=1 Tax=Coprinellus micaceus TaxID=71717 RepID=A0A4Y7T1W6_COPMI|nr:hypothetical protein FA13DRAFT_1712361 [Coprinellus micaceus]
MTVAPSSRKRMYVQSGEQWQIGSEIDDGGREGAPRGYGWLREVKAEAFFRITETEAMGRSVASSGRDWNWSRRQSIGGKYECKCQIAYLGFKLGFYVVEGSEAVITGKVHNRNAAWCREIRKRYVSNTTAVTLVLLDYDDSLRKVIHRHVYHIPKVPQGNPSESQTAEHNVMAI